MEVQKSGVNVVGVTTWSLLGTYDWVNLVIRVEGVYEPGVFMYADLSPDSQLKLNYYPACLKVKISESLI
ncbi:hypothetical protein [Adhaeribacter pallidiroseus]|uniref:hypothetical protein n=1 Tax=Adhaeribacter pallidiroseus TaxID=2072847 RepID=UPI0011C04915|nr:hypothetical protein [Adhaeribacter pallidiroseus]